uniref:Transmembrane protein 33 n=1 Tax=Romanomermis culicivorax TaxID=13658 RepID=A0A915IX62_ROMCU
MADVNENSSPSNNSVFAMLKEKKIDTVLWILRFLTLIFGVLYVLPLTGNQQICYQRALMAGALTHFLRLRQRLGGVRFNMQFLQEMFLEDSCHYLLFCFIFWGSHPITMALMPIFLFALLHWTSFTIQILNVRENNVIANLNESTLARILNNFVSKYSQTCLQIIACCEIFLMPAVVIMIFSGKSNFLIPFIYYRFLTLRYMSRRNPSTRQAFGQLRFAVEQTVNKPACPQILRNLAYKLINIICRMAPN